MLIGSAQDGGRKEAAVAQRTDIPGAGHVLPVRVGEGEFLLELLTGVHRAHPQCEFVRQQHVVVAEHSAVGAVAVGGHVDAPALFAQVGPRGGGIDDTGRAAHAKEQGIGAAIDLHPFRVVAVHRNEAAEKIPGLRRFRQSAHAGARRAAAEAGLADHAPGRGFGAREIAAEARGFHVGLVNKELAQVGGTGVFEELGVDDGDRGADVGELGLKSRAGERLGRLVTDVGTRSDDKGR